MSEESIKAEVKQEAERANAALDRQWLAYCAYSTRQIAAGLPHDPCNDEAVEQALADYDGSIRAMQSLTGMSKGALDTYLRDMRNGIPASLYAMQNAAIRHQQAQDFADAAARA